MPQRLLFYLIAITVAVVFKKTDDVAVARFHAVGPAGFKIDGTTHDVDILNDANGYMIVRVQLHALSTGIALRDQHMRDKYLEIQQYPYTQLRVDPHTLVLPTNQIEEVHQGQGLLLLHGQERNIVFHYKPKLEANHIHVVAQAELDITDYHLAVPNYFGVTVKPHIGIDIEFTLQNAS